METQELEELRILKEYNEYLNEKGLKRLVYLWNKQDKEDRSAKKNGM